MIMAEVRIDDESPWDTKLFNCSHKQFSAMANRRYVAVGKTLEIPTGTIIQYLRKIAGWNELPDGGFIRPKHYK